MLVIVGFLLIILLVIVHEAGHFFAARRAGIVVEEFGIGFPPRAKILGKKNGTTYTLNWLPLGGFVKLKGEHDADKTPGSFGATKLTDKVKVMMAGVVINFLVAYLMFTFIALVGMPKLVDNQFTVASDNRIVKQEVLAGYVEPSSPAQKAGLQNKDRIISIIENGNCSDCQEFTFNKSGDLGVATKALAGKAVAITILRDGKQHKLQAYLRNNKEVEASKGTANQKGYLGVIPDNYIVQRATWSAPIVGAGVTAQFTRLTFDGLGSIVTGLFHGDTKAATQQVSGIVGIGYVLSDSSFLGSIFMLMVVAVISLSLAIINLLPIPALDGGRVFVTLLYRVIKKPLTKTAEERIHGTGFALLMVLFVLITVLDVQRFIL